MSICSDAISRNFPAVVSVNEACHLLGNGRDKIYALIEAHELESYVDGHRRRIVVASIEAYIKRRLKEAHAA